MVRTIPHYKWEQIFQKAQSSDKFNDTKEIIDWMRKKWRDSEEIFEF